MNLDIVTFKQAKALKELGFPQNIYTSKVYLEKTIPHDIIAKECGLSDWQCISGKLIPCSSDYNKYGVDTCVTPTLELVAKWLREEKDIVIIPQPFSYDYIEKRTNSYILTMWFGDNFEEYSTPYNTYEDALSAGIDKVIENLKN